MQQPITILECRRVRDYRAIAILSGAAFFLVLLLTGVTVMSFMFAVFVCFIMGLIFPKKTVYQETDRLIDMQTRFFERGLAKCRK